MANKRKRSVFGIDRDLFTPVDDAVRDLIRQQVKACGSRNNFHEVTWMTLKTYRDLMQDTVAVAISFSLMDRLIVTTGVGSLDDFKWHPAEDMADIGIWARQMPWVGLNWHERKADRKARARRNLEINMAHAAKKKAREAKKLPPAPPGWRIPT